MRSRWQAQLQLETFGAPLVAYWLVGFMAQAYGRRGCGAPEGRGMAIYRLLQNSAFGPKEIAFLSEAYEQSLRALGLKDRDDPTTELVAKKIIEIGQTGLRDPKLICERALFELGVPPR
jgi:hypothetical protein